MKKPLEVVPSGFNQCIKEACTIYELLVSELVTVEHKTD